MLSTICFNLDQSKILWSGTGLKRLINCFSNDDINFVLEKVKNSILKGENAGC